MHISSSLFSYNLCSFKYVQWGTSAKHLLKVSTPLAEAYTCKLWRGRKWFGHSILPKSRFFSGILFGQSNLDDPTCVSPNWQSLGGLKQRDVLPPIYRAACLACSSGQLQPRVRMCKAAPSPAGRLVICLAQSLPCSVQPQEHFC